MGASHTRDDVQGARAALGRSVFLKCENFQRVGAFKFRGAMNAVLQLSDAERSKGVITHSSGNHAQAVALAGKIAGIPVTVVMPRNAPPVKRAATEGYGARIVPCEPTFRAREDTVAAEIERHGFTLIHPFDNWNVIAGQGTAALELLDDAGPLDLIICPVGGGGLLAGTALAAESSSRRVQVMAGEPASADDARRSLEAGQIEVCQDPATIADGLRTTSIGERNFAVIKSRVSRIVAVSEQEIVDAMRLVWERIKIVIEPSSAVAVAPLLNGGDRRPLEARRCDRERWERRFDRILRGAFEMTLSAMHVLGIVDILIVLFFVLRGADVRMVLSIGGLVLFLAAGRPALLVTKLAAEMANPATVVPICSAMGFAYVLRLTECDQHLVLLLLAPLRRMRLLLVPGGIIAGYVINTTIVSQAGTAAVLGPVLIPLLRAGGLAQRRPARFCSWARRWAASCSTPAPSRSPSWLSYPGFRPREWSPG